MKSCDPIARCFAGGSVPQTHSRSLGLVNLFASLDPSVLADIERRCSWSTYSAGTTIIDFLDQEDSVFFLIGGRAHVVVYSSRGKAVEFRELRSGDWFGESEALRVMGYPALIEASQDCVVAKLSGARFQQLVESNLGLSNDIIAHLKEQLSRLAVRVFEFSNLTVKERVQAELLRLVHSEGVSESMVVIRNPPTHVQFARRISTHREAVARELNQLARNGVIERTGGSLIVRDVSYLERLVEVAMVE
ncbi:MAG: Crp/Fnr family transcriptional regulator [Pseudomonadota bacterium]